MSADRFLLGRSAASAAALAAAAVLTACGGGSAEEGHTHAHGNGHGHAHSGSSSPSATAAHNTADVSFLQGMIPHHRQAVVMGDLADTRASSSEVRELADAIRKAQRREIETMSRWLRAWGEEVPGHSDHGGHGGRAMPGMLSAEQMERLRASSGKAFDTLYLRLMIEHHRGAVEMAEKERAEGRHGPAKDLADAIITSQTAEIGKMDGMLAAVE